MSGTSKAMKKCRRYSGYIVKPLKIGTGLL